MIFIICSGRRSQINNYIILSIRHIERDVEDCQLKVSIKKEARNIQAPLYPLRWITI